MRICHRLAVVALFGALGPVLPAEAAIDFVSADRSVSASVTGGTPQTIASSSLGVFDQTAQSGFIQSVGVAHNARMQQTSNFAPTSIGYRVSGVVLDSIPPTAPTADAMASWAMTVRFLVDTPTPYATSNENFVFVSPGLQAPAMGTERLTRVGGADVFSQSISIAGVPFANFAGVLAPGTYDFVVNFSISSAANGTSSSASVSGARTLHIPAPAGGGLVLCAGIAMRRQRRA